MKKSIVDYILRSPEERERLNINLILRKFPTSRERICKQGGYSTRLYPDWHQFINEGKVNL